MEGGDGGEIAESVAWRVLFVYLGNPPLPNLQLLFLIETGGVERELISIKE